MSVAAPRGRERPKAFAQLWGSPGTPRPSTTVAAPLGPAGRPVPPTLRRLSIGERYRRLAPEELAAVPAVDRWGGIDLSPDASEVAFSWDRTGEYEIYTAPLRGDRIIQLTDGGARSVAPRWSPDGRWLAFLRAGEGGMSMWVVDRDGERERRITRVGGAYRDPSWSPGGTRIALADDRSVYAIDVATGESPRIGEGARPCWSPDGRSILLTRAGDILVAPSGGGDARPLVTGEGALDARWSPDGSQVAFTAPARGPGAGATAPRSVIAFASVRDGGVARVERLEATPFDGTDPVWRPDGRGVVYRRHERGTVPLRRVFTVSHADDAAIDVSGSCAAAAVAADSETVVAVLAEATGGADVVVRGKGAVTLARITRSLPAAIDPRLLVEPAYVEDADGARSALVYVPHAEAVPGGRRAVVVGHSARPERGWDPAAQLLANHGHVVVVSAARGSDAETRAREVLREARLADGGAVIVQYEPTGDASADRPTREERLRVVLAAAERGR